MVKINSVADFMWNLQMADKPKNKEKSELEELKIQNAELKQELEKARLENENNRMREEIDLLKKRNLPSP